VDSSTERLEFLADGPGTDKQVIATANGVRLKFVDVANDRKASGIRYRLFDNPWGLQPHVKAHSPLRIEIVDKATGKIAYALDFLNWKPKGESYDSPPVTEDDARQRVEERLQVRGDLVGSTATVHELPASPLAPTTLDLRRA
jgi:uncharacterized protein (DUF2126 family)